MISNLWLSAIAVIVLSQAHFGYLPIDPTSEITFFDNDWISLRSDPILRRSTRRVRRICKKELKSFCIKMNKD